MKSLLILNTAFLLVFTAACGTMREKNEKKQDAAGKIQKAELVENIDEFRKSAPVRIISVSLTDNVLKLDIEFSGGCNEHSFRLLGSTAILKSFPAQRGIMLFHENNGDSCRELLLESLYFDISAFAYPNSEIILNLDGWPDKIPYTATK